MKENRKAMFIEDGVGYHGIAKHILSRIKSRK
jgi:hypothetical protein